MLEAVLVIAPSEVPDETPPQIAPPTALYIYSWCHYILDTRGGICDSLHLTSDSVTFVCLSVNEDQWKQFDLEARHAISLATEH